MKLMQPRFIADDFIFGIDFGSFVVMINYVFVLNLRKFNYDIICICFEIKIIQWWRCVTDSCPCLVISRFVPEFSETSFRISRDL